MALYTAEGIVDQAMSMVGNTRIETWGLSQLNRILRRIYRSNNWPFLLTNSTALSTTVSQAYTDISSLTTLWKILLVQIQDSSSNLFTIEPLKGGLPKYYSDTSRLLQTGRPYKYVHDRANSYIRWADSIPTAAETINLTYQLDEDDEALTDTPKLVTYTKNGEMYLLWSLLRDMRLYLGELNEAAVAAKMASQLEDELLSERLEDTDALEPENANDLYV